MTVTIAALLTHFILLHPYFRKNSEALALVQAGLVDVAKARYSVQIRQALTHPGSLEHQDLHNLGLLELEEPLEFGPLVGPICLLDKADKLAHFRDCWLPGWTMLEGEWQLVVNCDQD